MGQQLTVRQLLLAAHGQGPGPAARELGPAAHGPGTRDQLPVLAYAYAMGIGKGNKGQDPGPGLDDSQAAAARAARWWH